MGGRQKKQVEQRQPVDDHADAAFAEAVATARLQIAREETKRRLEEQGIQVGIGKSGNAFDLAREDNPGKWVKQLLLQRDAERQRFLEQLTKEYAKEFPSGGASDVELRKSWLYAKFDCFIKSKTR